MRPGGEKISIAEGTPIVKFSPATDEDVSVGAGVVVLAAGNSMDSDRVLVGLNALVPPM